MDLEKYSLGSSSCILPMYMHACVNGSRFLPHFLNDHAKNLSGIFPMIMSG